MRIFGLDGPTRLVVLASVVVVSLSCGKRGDPLPPLRPRPAKVGELQLRQRGPFIYLEWNAPGRNMDGSTEVELEEVVVLRRVMDIPPPPAPEPETTSDPEAGLAEGEELPAEGEEKSESLPEEKEATEEEPPPPEGVQQQPAEAEETGATPVGEETAPDAAPPPPTTPPAPPFARDSEIVATLESTETNERITFRDPWDTTWEGKRVEYAVRHVNRKGRSGALSPVVKIDPLAPPDPPEGLVTEVGMAGVRLRWKPAC